MDTGLATLAVVAKTHFFAVASVTKVQQKGA